METIRVHGVVGSEDETQAWDVNVDLHIDDDGRIVDYEQIEFGAAPPPPTGGFKLIFFHGDRQHVAHGRIERQTWQQVTWGSAKESSDGRRNEE